MLQGLQCRPRNRKCRYRSELGGGARIASGDRGRPGSRTNNRCTQQMMKETVIDIQNLEKSFGNQHVLKGVNLTLHKEENLVVLGKSGTGKSVLIKCIVRLLDPDKGLIDVFGEDITRKKGDELAELRKRIGFLFQSGALYDSMTVRENLEFMLKRLKKGIKRDEINKKVEEALENVGL